METLTFRMAAKTDVGRVRTNNEDNFQVASDLRAATMSWQNNQICTLGEKGALLVVADGMGGMNAGEVASEIAINTIRSYFESGHITAESIANDATINAFMKKAVSEADRKIKEEARNRPETKGMGTTLVIGWLLKGRLYVAWCGDSRAYVYNPINGLKQISKDHSYVQELVDAGRLRPEDAFDYPDSNIITRCLSDSSTPAIADCLSVPYEVCLGDIILLCSDGLSGLLRDKEIEQLLAAYRDDMDAAVTALIDGACNAGGHDNVTVCLCQIMSGAKEAVPSNRATQTTGEMDNTQAPVIKKQHTLLYCILAVLLTGIIGMGTWWVVKKLKNAETTSATFSSIKVESIGWGECGVTLTVPARGISNKGREMMIDTLEKGDTLIMEAYCDNEHRFMCWSDKDTTNPRIYIVKGEDSIISIKANFDTVIIEKVNPEKADSKNANGKPTTSKSEKNITDGAQSIIDKLNKKEKVEDQADSQTNDNTPEKQPDNK